MKKYYLAAMAISLSLLPLSSALAFTPGTPEAYFEGQIQGLWQEDASNKTRIGALESSQGTGTDQSARITQLESDNRALKSQVDWMDGQLKALAAKVNQGPTISSAPVNTTVVQEADMSRVAAVEKRLNVLEAYLYMVEQRIGELYARVDMLIAPVYKALRIK